jgi:hypothetical protein|nr:MAG TPA: hypothetical protein [Caudoviricetes sp.]
MSNIKRWWFKKKIQFLCNCVKQINKLYNKYCRKQRVPLLGEIEDITPDEAKELLYFLQAIRDLEYDIWRDYHAIDDD